MKFAWLCFSWYACSVPYTTCSVFILIIRCFWICCFSIYSYITDLTNITFIISDTLWGLFHSLTYSCSFILLSICLVLYCISIFLIIACWENCIRFLNSCWCISLLLIVITWSSWFFLVWIIKWLWIRILSCSCFQLD